MESNLILKLWRGPMPSEMVDSLKHGILDMYESSHISDRMSWRGFFDATWEVILACCGGTGELWLALDGNSVKGFLVAGFSKQIENENTFVLRQAWWHKDYRRQPIIRDYFNQVLRHAKGMLCLHVVVISSRGSKGYLRWLGKGWNEYTVTLKGDL